MSGYLVPDRRKNGRWIYGFADMEVGDTMRCPFADGENSVMAQVRVLSAAICWKKKNKQEEREHIVFRSEQRTKYVLIERMS